MEQLAPFACLADQYEFRKNIIMEVLEAQDFKLNRINAVVGRGGLIKPVPSGVIEVNEKLKYDLRNSPLGEHASNLGGLIADDIARSLSNARAFIADPVVVDEMGDIARIAGHPLFERKSILHALNQKAVARMHAKNIHKEYKDLNLIVAHLGGGITVGAHQKGRVIDVNNGLDGEGPFSPERSGTLPAGAVIRLCFSGQFTQEQMRKMVIGKGGLVAYLGTNSALEVEERAMAGDDYALIIYQAMAYQVARWIGEMGTVLKGEVDAILITGGVAYSHWFVNQIIQRVHKIAPVFVYPGEDEMKALAMNGLMALNGEIEIIKYE